MRVHGQLTVSVGGCRQGFSPLPNLRAAWEGGVMVQWFPAVPDRRGATGTWEREIKGEKREEMKRQEEVHSGQFNHSHLHWMIREQQENINSKPKTNGTHFRRVFNLFHRESSVINYQSIKPRPFFNYSSNLIILWHATFVLQIDIILPTPDLLAF